MNKREEKAYKVGQAAGEKLARRLSISELRQEIDNLVQFGKESVAMGLLTGPGVARTAGRVDALRKVLAERESNT